jgi:hypothetical protein
VKGTTLSDITLFDLSEWEVSFTSVSIKNILFSDVNFDNFVLLKNNNGDGESNIQNL